MLRIENLFVVRLYMHGIKLKQITSLCVWDIVLIHTGHGYEGSTLDCSAHVPVITGARHTISRNTHNENYSFQTENCFGVS